MSTNLQPIPLGIIGIQPFIDIVCQKFELIEPLDTTYQNNAFVNAPTVFVDGILLTYTPLSDRRYISFNPETRTITINNSEFQEGETIQIFL